MRLLNEIRNLIGNYHVKSGVYHYHRNEHKQAVEFLSKALADETLSDADRANACHYLTLSRIDHAVRLQATGDLEGAAAELQLAAPVSPGYPDIRFRMGVLFEQLERPEQALEHYRAAIECNPNYLDAHVALGFCLLANRHTDEAAEAFREALRIKLDQIQLPFGEGMALLSSGDDARAVECLHQAFLSVPRLADEYLRKALDRLKAEEHEDALENLDRALELSPKYPDLHNFRGIALCGLERYEEACRAFALSAELSPDYLVPRLNLAFARLRAGEYGEAETELEAILEKDPNEPVAAAKLQELRTGRPAERRPTAKSSVR